MPEKTRSPSGLWIASLSLGVFGLAQLVTVWTVLRPRPELDTAEPAPVVAAPAPRPKEEPAAAPAKPQEVQHTIVRVPPPPLEIPDPLPDAPGLAATPDEAIPPPPEAPGPDPTEEPPMRPFADPQAARSAELAKLAIGEGDLVKGLQLLEAAHALAPEHPNLLYEMAKVYEKIGSRPKALALFEKVSKMGEAEAGQLAKLARLHLTGGAKASTIHDPFHRPLAIGKVVKEEQATEKDHSVSLSVTIEGVGDAEIENPNETVQVHVFFYDLVDGKKLDQSLGDRPQDSWLTAPTDWKGSPREELLRVVLRRPGDVEKRAFFGYVIKLYYRDEIQDVVAEPRMLVEKLSHGQEDANDGLPTDALFGK